MPKRTPLYQQHLELGARCIDFGGWEMPVQYAGIVAEHQAVRAAAGVFDISHMGEIWVGGAHASEFLNQALTNDIGLLAVGEGQYTLMCNESGGVVDDLYVYRIASEAFLLMVNATRISADLHWLEFQASNRGEDRRVKVEDQSAQIGAVAVQGPAALLFIDELFHGDGLISAARPGDLVKNQVDAWRFGSGEVYVARTGYTGEEGFEIIAPNEQLAALWDQVLEVGRPHGIVPAGLGARDTLRLEMGYPLYGHELSESLSPIEAGCGYFVKVDKGKFTGRSALMKQKDERPKKKIVAFKMNGNSPPPRQGYEVYNNLEARKEVWSVAHAGLKPQETDPVIGVVTSGTQSPSLGCGIGMAQVHIDRAREGTVIDISIRGKRYPATVCKKPLYKKQ
ncbi:MAG: glycine cleavage system aminomethyltransferase GcvT [Verrucomicrobia subdivision 3 bacterium]|nr:glycine cleavage system aminomethyltransferase GcvT [Limisphaerales bacterium]